MQKFLAVILLAIAALEGVVAAPVADTAAVDVRTNEKFPASPAFDGAEDIYGRDLADNEDEKQKRGEDPGAFPDVGQPLQVDPVAMDSGETGGRAEPGALDARSFEMDELEARDLEDRDNEPASEANADNGGGLEKRQRRGGRGGGRGGRRGGRGGRRGGRGNRGGRRGGRGRGRGRN
ncbi:hypothetical protein PG990_005768 [Apiospora arundinis]